LTLQNDALLLKHLDKFYNKRDLPWVHLIWNSYYTGVVPHLACEVGSFWWTDIMRLHPFFRGIALCRPGVGDTISLWDDLWDGKVPMQAYQRLYSFTNDMFISLQCALELEQLHSLFHLPLSPQAYAELLFLQHDVVRFRGQSAVPDSWSYIGGSTEYTSSKFYHLTFATVHTPPIIKNIWKSKCMPRIKFFMWLLLNDK